MRIECERVYRMKEKFMELHNKGYAIPKIAEIFDISPASVYRHLQEIADANGTTRDELLEIVRQPNLNSRAYWDRDAIDMNSSYKNLKEGFEELDSRLTEMIQETLKMEEK